MTPSTPPPLHDPVRTRLRSLVGILTAAFCLLSRAPAGQAEPSADRPPNILFMLADDLGYGDLGSYGQQRIRTPHLDRLAREGMRLRQHYSGNAVCAPSRCVLMTGRHPGHAIVRDNRELRPEGQFPLPAGTPNLARLLRDAGYVTGAFGKWGLGGPDSVGAPIRQGFDRFFGYNCQRIAHNYYPTHLWDDTRRVALGNPDFPAHQRFPADADPSDSAAFGRYSGNDFAPDRILGEALRFVRTHRDRPFFLYFPTTVPHLALQVPGDSLTEYAGAFPEEPYLGDRAYLPHRTPRAAYAAMVTRMDRDVGRLLNLIDELGLARDTIVVFTSDNGPLYDRLGGTDTDFFNSAGGLRGRKGSLLEGGIRVPCIVRWPQRVPASTTSDRVTGFEDWLPTLLELTRLADRVPAGIDGISFAPTLLGDTQPERPFLYREFPGYGGQQMIRVGPWKAIRQNLVPPRNAPEREPDLRLRLHHLENDPGEAVDVATDHPEIVAGLKRLMQEQHTASPDFPIPALDGMK